MACYLPSHVGVAPFTTLWRCVPKLGGQRALPRQHPNANAAYYCSRARANVKGGCELLATNPVEAEDISSSSGESDLKGNPTKLEDFPHSSVVSNLKGDGLKSSNDRLMLIDGTAVIYRAYFKLMSRLHHGYLQYADGNGDWVLTIFTALSTMIDMLELGPSHVAVVFDHDGLTFRHTLYPAYKGNRIPTPDTIVQGLQYLKAAMKAMSIKVIEVPGVEADDVIGTLATSGVAASLKMIDMLELGPSHVAVVFDHDGNPFGYKPFNQCKQVCIAKGLTFRHTLYPAYKGNRIPTPDTIVQGLQYLKAAMKAMSIKVIEVPGVEADDVIGTLATSGVAASLKVRIVSPDKDFFQILSPSLRILRVAPRGSQVVSFGLEQFAEKYGDLKPSQIVDVMALAGDKADNIPGIDGIGNINALKLIMEFGSVENLLHCLDQVADDNIRKLLRHNTGQALLSKSLASLRSDLPFYIVPFKISDLVFEKPQDKGKKFINLLRAISAYAEGSSAVNIVNRALSLWEKC